METVGLPTQFSELERSKENLESNFYKQAVDYLSNMNEIYKTASNTINTKDKSQIPFFAEKTARNITENIDLINKLIYSVDETIDISPEAARLIAEHRYDQSKYSTNIKSQFNDPRSKYYETINTATNMVDGATALASSLVGAFVGVMMVKALRQSSSTNKSGGNKKTRKHKRKTSKTVKKNKVRRVKSHKKKHNKTRK